MTEPWHSLHVVFLCECAASSVLEPHALLSACLVLCWSVVFGSRHSCLEFRFRVGVRTLALHVLSHCVSVRLEFARHSVLTPPILLPDYWLICPTCVHLVTLLICSLYNLLLFAVPCWFVVECILSCPVQPCQAWLPACFPLRGSFCLFILVLYINESPFSCTTESQNLKIFKIPNVSCIAKYKQSGYIAIMWVNHLSDYNNERRDIIFIIN